MNFLTENATGLVVGILSATMSGTIGYLVWLFFQKRTAKFSITRNMWFIKLILLSFVIPILGTMLFWILFRVQVQEAFFYGRELSLTTPMIAGFLLLALVWLVATVVILIYRNMAYWKLRYLYIMSVPVEDSDILMNVEKWKKKLQIKKKVNIFYNRTLSSPTLIYYNGYKILLPVYGLDKQELNMALLHELTHLKNGDVLMKNIGFVVNAMHSFNPISYYLRMQIVNWLEANCDLQCCEIGEEEFEPKEYFECIMDLKERCKDDKQPDLVSCLFESKEMLNFRIEAVKRTRENGKQGKKYFVIQTAFAVCLMLFSFCTVSKTISYCYGKTLNYKKESMVKEEERGFKEGLKKDVFANAEVNYYDKDILNDSEGAEFSLDAGEITVFTLPEQCSDKLTVVLFSSGEEIRFGFAETEDRVKYIEEFNGSIVIDKKDMEGERQIFVKNTGKEACQIEIFISEKIQ